MLDISRVAPRLRVLTARFVRCGLWISLVPFANQPALAQEVCSDIAVTDTIEIKKDASIDAISGIAVLSTNSTGNKKIELKDDSTIIGDLYVGVGGDPSDGIEIDADAVHTGDQGILPQAALIETPALPNPPCGPTGGGGCLCGNLEYDDATVTISSDMRVCKFEIKGSSIVTIVGDVTIVVDDNFNLKDEAEVRLAPGASLTLFSTDKDITIEDDARLNSNTEDASLVAIYQLSNDKIELRKDSIAYATIVGPDSEFSLKDESAFFGTFRGNEIKIDKNSQLNIDTRQCNPVENFLITHDNNGVNCQAENISVTGRDRNGNTVTNYTGTILLDTQTSTGDWTLVTGSGSFADTTPDDGLATYSYAVPDSGVATFALTYSSGPEFIDVDVSEGVYRDDDTEGDLRFSPTAFTLTATPISNPPPNPINDPIVTQTSGTEFPVSFAAYGTTPTDPECGIIEAYTGDKLLRFWVEHLDPTIAPLVPTVDDNPVSPSEALASDQTVLFTDGQATVRVKYKDVGRLSIAALDMSNPAIDLRGATGGFVSRPADLAVVSVTNASGDPNPMVDTPSGALFARAGEDFAVRVEARDAEGSRTPSYGNEAFPEGIRLASAVLVAPAGGRNGTLDNGAISNATGFVADVPAGTFEGLSFGFDEVGAIRLNATVADGDYMATGDVTGTLSPVVGRFAPSHFEAALNTPTLDTGCDVGAFTWLEQPFEFTATGAPVLTVTAQNVSGGRTANYAGDWWRITNDSLENRLYASSGVSINTDGIPDVAVDPVISSNGDGTGTLTFSSGSGLILERTAPVAPFEAEISLSIDVIDLDDTVYPTNPATFGGTTPGTGILFDVSKRFQFGRLRFENAAGSERVDLPMRLRTQRFDGLVFVDDDYDSCSRLDLTAFTLTSSPGTLPVAPSLQHSPLLSGDSGFSLSAPNEVGTVDIFVDLGPSGVNLPWLRYDWPQDGSLDGIFDDDPSARATFGIWSGRSRLIYMREIY